MLKTFLTFLLAIYVVLSFFLLINPNWIIENCNQIIADWVYNNYNTLYTVKVINFIFCFFVSIFTFYLQGYNDGKNKETIIKREENVEE